MNRLRTYVADITECTCTSLSWRYRWVCVLDNINPHRDVVVEEEDGYEYTEKRVLWPLRWLCRLHDVVIERGFERMYPELLEDETDDVDS